MRPLRLRLGLLGLLGLLALGPAPAAVADSWRAGTTYTSLQFARATLDAVPEVREQANPGVFLVRAGHRLTAAFALEGRLGIRAGSDQRLRGHLPGRERGNVEVTLDRLTGLYGSARLPLGGRFGGYALAGYSGARVALADREVGVSRREHGPSIGVGIDYAFGDDYRFEIEYMRYIDRSDMTLSAIAIGFSFRL